MQKNKVLIIRFSSFGDIIHCLSIVEPLKKKFGEDVEIAWLARKEFSGILRLHSSKINIIEFDRSNGLLGLIKLSFHLRKEGFSHVYDAHNNVRSFFVYNILRFLNFKTKFVRRSKNRLKRMLLFKFRINKFDKPFKAMRSYLSPLLKWGVDIEGDISSKIQLDNNLIEGLKQKISFENFYSLVPSAAWEMKRWPIEYWHELIQQNPDKNFVILGGPEDHFCQDFEDSFPNNVLNLAGKLSLIESCHVLSLSQKVVSGDTGLIQVADLFGFEGIMIIGPTAFGHPSSKNIQVKEVNLECRPCTKDGRGSCSQDVYKKCLVDIKPNEISSSL